MNQRYTLALGFIEQGDVWEEGGVLYKMAIGAPVTIGAIDHLVPDSEVETTPSKIIWGLIKKIEKVEEGLKVTFSTDRVPSGFKTGTYESVFSEDGYSDGLPEGILG